MRLGVIRVEHHVLCDGEVENEPTPLPVLGHMRYILIEIGRKSSVDAEATAIPVGRFVLSKKEKIAGDALDHLASLGAAGAPGLLEALETKVAAKKVEIIEALGKSGYYPAAHKLCTYLIKTDKPRPVQFKNAAKRALKSMGDQVRLFFCGLFQS